MRRRLVAGEPVGDGVVAAKNPKQSNMLGVPELLPKLRLMALAGRRGVSGTGCRPVGLIFQIQSTTVECDAGHNFPLLNFIFADIAGCGCSAGPRDRAGQSSVARRGIHRP